jgi:Tfp pilus assembly protein FimT
MSETGEAGAGFGAQAGTTLIEALAVVAITTMIALIGFPRLQQGILTLSQRETVAVVAARLREARGQAMRHNRRIVFAVAADGVAYGATIGKVSQTPAGVSLATSGAENGRIVFFGDGSSSGGQVMVSANRRTIPVTVIPQTGVVMVGGG